MPWLCARNPLYFSKDPGLIDLECKRILGKRFKPYPDVLPVEYQSVDPIARLLAITGKAGHTFASEAVHPILSKTPGKLLPRRLSAKAQIAFRDTELCLYSRNFSELSQCLHAELTLIFGLSQILSELPNAPEKLECFKLETALKPCKMCAAFLHILRKKCLTFQVNYFEDDPGRLASHTLLDRYGYHSRP